MQDSGTKPRVVVTTDINNGAPSDPDDRQSLCHLLFYADMLDVVGIIPDGFKETATQACLMAFDKYEEDYNSPSTKYKEFGYPPPDYFRNTALKAGHDEAVDCIIREAHRDDPRPLYVLVWGHMTVIRDALAKDDSIVEKIRLITIATNIMADWDSDGTKMNWNGHGRNEVFEKYPKLWWVECDWIFSAMFHGLQWEGDKIVGGRPVDMMNFLAERGGALGAHVKEVVWAPDTQWARYFRAGDTPSVLYVVDPDNDLDNPAKGSWAGRYVKPFPDTRPDYWIDIDGGFEWDFANPGKTWHNGPKVYEARAQTLLDKREEMYEHFRNKVLGLYAQVRQGDTPRAGHQPA